MNRRIEMLLLTFCCTLAQASEMVYTPINPSFGGNPANATMLMSNAQAQNTTKAPQPTQLETFNKNLQQAILNRVASQAMNTMFAGNYKLTPGAYDTGTYSITVTQNPDGSLTVVTLDKTTGAAANFVVSPGI